MIYSSSSCDNLSHNEIIERAENGDSEAQYILGIYYNNDRTGESDDEKSFHWLKLAAEQGHCEAQYFLGRRFKNPTSNKKDYQLSLF